MSATYDSSLPANLDWVRYLIQDTDITSPKMQDEEITAVLADQLTTTGDSVKYYAAADCLSALLASWTAKGDGILEKEVDDLRIKYGAGSSAAEAVRALIDRYRERGADRTITTGSRILTVSPRQPTV